MTISSADLINLPVHTKSGRNLGKVSSFDLVFEGDAAVVARYYVKTGLIQGLWHQQLIIDKSQVLSITKLKMIVDDNLVNKKAGELGEIPAMTPVTE